MNTSRPRRLYLALVPAAILAATVTFPGLLHAQSLEHLSLRVEGGIGAMLSTDQRNVQGYFTAFDGVARVAYRLTEPIAIQVGVANWHFPNPRGDGGALFVAAGVRFEPIVGSSGRLFADFDIGSGFTGGLNRAMFDLGIGLEFTPTAWLGIGPTIRYGRMIAATTDVPADPQFVAVNLSLSLRYPTPKAPEPIPVVIAQAPPPPPDTDADGILDPDDRCISDAPGEHPDPARPGCPALDTDHDGVVDPDDRCPTEAAGEHPSRARAGCADQDADRDGVYDETDQCAAQPSGIHPDAARAGCPLPDRDGDSVPDPIDACADQAGAPNATAARNGCAGLVRISGNRLEITAPVAFVARTTRIQPRSVAVLQAVADVLAADPTITRLAVEAHTDDVGDDAANLTLSRTMADSVVAWLTQHGVAASRLEAHGAGETRPLLIGTTAAARAGNRRIEFHIVPAAQPVGPASTSAPPASATPGGQP